MFGLYSVLFSALVGLATLGLMFYFVRKVDKAVGISNPTNLIAVGEFDGITVVSSFADYLSAATATINGKTLRLPQSFMLFGDDTYMGMSGHTRKRPQTIYLKTGSTQDLEVLLKGREVVRVADMYCPAVGQDWKRCKGMTLLDLSPECYRKMFGYTPGSWFAQCVAYFDRKPDALYPLAYIATTAIVLTIAGISLNFYSSGVVLAARF